MINDFRIGFAYLTIGVVSPPIEGFTELKLGKTREGKDYFITVANSGNGVRKRADGILIDEKTGKVIPKEYILTIDMAKEIAMYEEILFIIGSFETGLAGELEKKYKKKQLIDYKKEFTNEDLRLLLGNRDN